MVNLVWLRRDLRIHDNPALAAALKNDQPLVFLFIEDSAYFGGRPINDLQRCYLYQSLELLQKKIGSKSLIIEQGDAVKLVPKIIKQYQITSLFFNTVYEPDALAADEKLIKDLKASNVEIQVYNGTLLHEFNAIVNKQGSFYKVFTPYYKSFLTLPIRRVVPSDDYVYKKNASKIVASLEISELLEDISVETKKIVKTFWNPGEEAACKRLQFFIDNGLAQYAGMRDVPGVDGTSLFSVALHFGELSPCFIWHQVQQARASVIQKDAFLRQLVWREFSAMLGVHYPDSITKPLRQEFAAFSWQRNATLLRAWQEGKTGYPIVDAGMRQLLETGWMHNRVRMIVASFLTKDLLLHWHAGEEWFWQHLLDADRANNAFGWQWVAGCGADAQPFFRIFNPVEQGKKFDPKGEYVRQWVPELVKLDNKYLHAPWKATPLELLSAGVTLGKHYPYPIVDHGIQRKEALKRYSYMQHTKLSD